MKTIFIEVIQGFSVLVIVVLLEPEEIWPDMGYKLHAKL